MKIASLSCACTEGNLPLDHFSSGECTSPPLPLELLGGIFTHLTGDTFHADGRITATRLATCPREIAIVDALAIEGVDLTKGNSTFWGTMKHLELWKRKLPGTTVEIEIPPTPLFGVMVSGKVDKVSADLSTIEDWKTHAENGQRYAVKEVKASNIIQLNIYALLLKKSRGIDIKNLAIWHLAEVGGSGVPCGYRQEIPLLPEEVIAEMPIDEGTSVTVQEIADAYRVNAAARPLLGEGTREEWLRWFKLFEMVGVNLFNGKKCEKYCWAKGICDEVEAL